MNNLIQWIGKYIDPIQTVMNVVIAIVAAVVIGYLVIKAISAAKKNSYSEIGKYVASILVVVVLAALGIGGMTALANAIRPDDLQYSNDKFK